MAYISAQQAAVKWGISKRRVQHLCSEQRIQDAVRIGYMWVVPENAEKPIDARKRANGPFNRFRINPIKSARKALKTFSTAAFQIVQEETPTAYIAKKSLMSELVYLLLEHVVQEEIVAIAPRIYAMFDLKDQLSALAATHIRNLFYKFLNEHPYCIDDALSWTYQFVNKLSKDTRLEATQFFTEKYMIAALVDQCDIKHGDGKILDPACGGGNFLLYALDCLYTNERISPELSLTNYLQRQLQRLYGYELDPVLSLIASANLRIKALSILREHGENIIAEDFFRFVPHIYCSVEDNIEGALDVNPSTHRVVQVGTNYESSLASVFNSAEYIFTNPPFQTVKGMDKALKFFLKSNYPNAKCDLCNTFIEFVLKNLVDGGFCGLVTQNSWMYLDSFEKLRTWLFNLYSIKSIIELGSNAFYDISGEKANVALLLVQKAYPNAETSIITYSLKHLTQPQMESILLSSKEIRKFAISQKQFMMMQSPGARLGILSTCSMQTLQANYPSYGEYAIPMQGTSTGDSRTLVSHFWEHIGDSNWVPVSKGGGFSRWLGLNNYSVKWGADGEYIKATPGSALRNAKYFGKTQMVFSDTGTAGLNVRLLLTDQIFIASGPGIRITQGDVFAHIAFLNSRFSSYFIRLLSPKLTIAAGYIAQIPVLGELLTSENLSEMAKVCIELKRNRLSKRPINLEFQPLSDVVYSTTLDEQAKNWFLRDVEDEWLQLCAEKEIDTAILTAYHLSTSDQENITKQVGCHALDINDGRFLSVNELDHSISELLDSNCMLNRTRPDKNHIGCDGVLEYLTHKNAISPSQILSSITQYTSEFHNTLAKYRNIYIHALVLSALGYSTTLLPVLPQKIEQVMDRIAAIYPGHLNELDEIEKWIKLNLNSFHSSAFLVKPIVRYSPERDVVEYARREI